MNCGGRLTVAEKIAEWLNEKGIKTVFGIVGGGNLTLWNAITRIQKTEIVCCHHEQAAVMAASSFYRVSGRISAALVTTGAGSTNAVTGVASAWMDSVPVLILSGNEASKYMYAPTRVWGVQGFDSCQAVEGMTKRAFRAEGMPDLDAALYLALKPRMGPVWCDIPKDTQNASV